MRFPTFVLKLDASFLSERGAPVGQVEDDDDDGDGDAADVLHRHLPTKGVRSQGRVRRRRGRRGEKPDQSTIYDIQFSEKKKERNQLGKLFKTMTTHCFP